MSPHPPHAPLPYLHAEWTTARLRVRDGRSRDAAPLTDLFNACSNVAPWDPTFQPVETAELAQLIAHSVAESGTHQGFRLQCIEHVAANRCIGYFHLHHHSPGLPQPRTPFISMFVIHPDSQGQRFAPEVVAGLAQQLTQLGYHAIWLEVYLKNWPALRFWIKQGFDHIIAYDGDNQLSDSAHATLVLEKRLTHTHPSSS